jgi:hypothetical protein
MVSDHLLILAAALGAPSMPAPLRVGMALVCFVLAMATGGVES